MWEVIAKSPITGKQRGLITDRWEKAKRFADLAMDKDWRVSIKAIYSDIIIADALTGNFIVFRQKVPPREAASFSLTWAKTDRESGCMLWPHGRPTPRGWNVIRENA